MKFFEFLAQMREERFPLRIDYREHMGCVDVEVEAFSERWVVSFDEDGFVTVVRDDDGPDNPQSHQAIDLVEASTFKVG